MHRSWPDDLVSSCWKATRPVGPPRDGSDREEPKTMPSPRVTVIISTYNRSEVLRCAVASVMAQTMADVALLVCGDGCTDDSEQVVLGVKDPRVRWINLLVNTGHQSGPNNRGLQEAKGEFVAY